MDSWIVIKDLGVLLAAAVLLGAICERFRQSAIVGYLIAGMCLGPNALQWIGRKGEVEVIAELGVALLLFTIGLEFSWRRLRSFGWHLLGGGAVQVVLTICVAALVAMSLGAGSRSAVVIACMLSLSSTACVLRVMEARSEIDSVHGRHALGVLLVQDIAVIPIVLVMGAMIEGSDASLIVSVGRSFLVAAAAIALLAFLFGFFVPRVLRIGVVYGNRELAILTAIVSGLAAVLFAHEAGLSPALGAFIAGMVLGASPLAVQVRADVASLKALFVTVFFASIGAYGDPMWMLAHWDLLILSVTVLLVGKSVLTWASMRVIGVRSVHGLAAGICLAQTGEFSFVIAEITRETLLGQEIFLLFVSTTLLSMLLTPYLVRIAPSLARRLLPASIAKARTSPGGVDPEEGLRVLVVGFGPAGRVVATELKNKQAIVSVLELNPRSIEDVVAAGFTAHTGDATHAEVLLHAGIERADAVIVTIPSPSMAEQIIRIVRSLAPDALIAVRGRFSLHVDMLRDAGAAVVLDEEEQIGHELASTAARQLGLESE